MELSKLQQEGHREEVQEDAQNNITRLNVMASLLPGAEKVGEQIPKKIGDGQKKNEPGLLSSFMTFGKDLAKSIWNGFVSFSIVQLAREWADRFMSSIRSRFRSSSPSKEMMKIGQDAMKGFAIGMGGSATSRNSSNINITVNVKGAFSSDPRTASQSVATSVLKGMTRQGAFSGAPLVA